MLTTTARDLKAVALMLILDIMLRPPQSDRIFLTAENPVQLDFITLIIMVKLSITLQVQEI